MEVHKRELNTKRPTLVFFLGPTKPLQSIRTGDTVLVKSAVERWHVGHFLGGWGGGDNISRGGGKGKKKKKGKKMTRFFKKNWG